MSLTIYIARHGQDEDNSKGILNGRRNTPLTQLGIEQAMEVASKIADAKLHFEAIYTSPLKRAMQTAKIISEKTGMGDPKILANLIERDFGVMTGQPASRIEEQCAPEILKTQTITYFLNPKDAEDFPTLKLRAGKLLAEVRLKHTEGNILLVTHGDFGKMIYAEYYNLNWQDVLTLFHFGNSELIILSENTPAEEAHVFTIPQFNH